MFSATLWPPLQFPPPVSKTGVGGTLAQPTSPPLQFPPPASKTGNGGTFGQPTARPLLYPLALVNNHQWTPSPPPVNNFAVQNYAITQQQINTYFRINGINPSPTV